MGDGGWGIGDGGGGAQRPRCFCRQRCLRASKVSEERGAYAFWKRGAGPDRPPAHVKFACAHAHLLPSTSCRTAHCLVTLLRLRSHQTALQGRQASCVLAKGARVAYARGQRRNGFQARERWSRRTGVQDVADDRPSRRGRALHRTCALGGEQFERLGALREGRVAVAHRVADEAHDEREVVVLVAPGLLDGGCSGSAAGSNAWAVIAHLGLALYSSMKRRFDGISPCADESAAYDLQIGHARDLPRPCSSGRPQSRSAARFTRQ